MTDINKYWNFVRQWWRSTSFSVHISDSDQCPDLNRRGSQKLSFGTLIVPLTSKESPFVCSKMDVYSYSRSSHLSLNFSTMQSYTQIRKWKERFGMPKFQKHISWHNPILFTLNKKMSRAYNDWYTIRWYVGTKERIFNVLIDKRKILNYL